VPSHVPVAPYVVEFVPLHEGAGGVVQLVAVHGVTHRPLVASHVPFCVVQLTVVGV